MYKNKLAVALKSTGKVLREFGDEVYLPFGSEYSIFIKNLNSVRALVSVSVDGVDVGDGTKFVVNANDSIDIERFIKDGNCNEGNRLKFVERTSGVENHRGVGIEDGLVRVEFQFEKRMQYNSIHWYSPSSPYWVYGSNYPTVTAQYNAPTVTYTHSVTEPVDGINDVGITVPGSISDQEFVDAGWFPVEDAKEVIVLKILGETENRQVFKPVTVKAKPKCVTCGRTNKATAKFCVECGTSLTIV